MGMIEFCVSNIRKGSLTQLIRDVHDKLALYQDAFAKEDIVHLPRADNIKTGENILCPNPTLSLLLQMHIFFFA